MKPTIRRTTAASSRNVLTISKNVILYTSSGERLKHLFCELIIADEHSFVNTNVRFFEIFFYGAILTQDMPKVKQTNHNKCYLRQISRLAKIFFVLSQLNKKIILVCFVTLYSCFHRYMPVCSVPFLFCDFIISAYVSHKKDFGTH